MAFPKKTVIQLLLLLGSSSLVHPLRVEELINKFLEKNIEGLTPRFKEVVPGQFITESTCEINKIEIKCNDCKSQLVCDGTLTGSVIDCPEEYPYCDPVAIACSATPASTCPDPNVIVGLRCSSSGYFPAPDDCSKYYVCDAIGSTPYAYQCPSRMVYDPNLGRCKTKRVSKDCSLLKCDLRSKSPVTVHPVYPQYFGICDTYNVNLGFAVAVLKCPNNFIFNPKTFSCDFKCRTKGYFLGSQRDRFVVCYKAGGKYKYIEETCPPDYYFDESSSNCLKTES